MKKSLLLILIVIGLLLSACQPAAPAVPPATPKPPETRTLTVFAAASLTDAFGEITGAFKSDHPGLEVSFNFAGSQQLAQQLAQGAPADVFASANQAQMDAAVKAGRVASGSSQVFVRNRLVVIYPKENPAGLASLQDLAKAGLKLVLAAKEVPVGGYSVQFLDKASQSAVFGADFSGKALVNVVSYEENVRAVYTKVALGEADAGIVYSTDVPEGNPDGVGSLDIPDELNVIAEYPIAPVVDSPNPDLARAFVDFVLSKTGQDILANYGFSAVR